MSAFTNSGCTWCANPARCREDGCAWNTRATPPVEPPSQPSPKMGEEAVSLTDWILKYLELECSLDTSCVSKADRSTVVNAVSNSLAAEVQALKEALSECIRAYGMQEEGHSGIMDKAIALARSALKGHPR